MGCRGRRRRGSPKASDENEGNSIKKNPTKRESWIRCHEERRRPKYNVAMARNGNGRWGKEMLNESGRERTGMARVKWSWQDPGEGGGGAEEGSTVNRPDHIIPGTRALVSDHGGCECNKITKITDGRIIVGLVTDYPRPAFKDSLNCFLILEYSRTILFLFWNGNFISLYT